MTFAPCAAGFPPPILSGMYRDANFTDSAQAVRPAGAPPAPWPATAFPTLTEPYLRDFFAHLSALSPGSLTAGLPTLTEPGLYTLAAALGRIARATPDRIPSDLADALLAELRWRNCRGMGASPTGPVRRGRLLQLVGAFTTLTPLGASPLQRDRLSADCPFCAAPAAFRLSLPLVNWRCFACARHGALLEFAAALLEIAPVNPAPPPTPDNSPAAS